MEPILTITNGSSALQLDEFTTYINGLDYSSCTKRAYVDGLQDYHKHGFSEVTHQLECQYRDMLIAEGKSGRTVNARLHALNAYNRWLGLPQMREIKVNEDPFAADGLELDEFHRFVDCLLADGKYHWYIAVKLLASTGMRIGEAVKVTYGDFRKGHALVYGKGNKPRMVYFSHGLRETLYLYIKDKDDSERMIPYSPHYVREALLRAKRRYGLECKASPHEYRRFFARQMYDATHDEALIKGLLGHENLKTTSRYIKKTERQAMHLYARSQNW